MAYNLISDTYSCDICGFEMQWDASDLKHGEMWGAKNAVVLFARNASSTVTGVRNI